MDRFLRDGKSIDGVWNDFMKKSKLNRKLEEFDITKHWEKLAGPLVARHTTNISYFNNKLTIYLDSAPLKQEISMRKSEWIKKINSGLKTERVKEIVIR